jgi:hypothetical protein
VGLVVLLRRPRDLPRVVAVVLLVAAPWYVYIWHATGNPVWPFAGERLGLGPWSHADLAAQMTDLHAHGARGPLDLLLLPYRLIVTPGAFGPEETVSPLPWLALATAVVTFGRDPRLRRWLVIIGAYLVYWFATPQLYRYLVPILPLVALAGAVSLAALIPTVRLRHSLTVLWVLPGLLWAIHELAARGLPPTTPAARDRWLEARMPAYRGVRLAATAGGRVYQLGLEDYMVYAGDAVGDVFGPWRYDRLLAHGDGPQAFVDELDHMGVRWLVVQRFRAPMYVPAHPRLALRHQDAGSAVFQLIP